MSGHIDPISLRARARDLASECDLLAVEIEEAVHAGALTTPGYAIGPAEHAPSTVATLTAARAQLTFWSERVQWAYDMGFLPGGRHNPTGDDTERIIR